MVQRRIGQQVVGDAAALAAFLFSPQHDIRDAKPPAHDAEGVTHGKERRLLIGPNRVEQRKQPGLPRGILLDTLGSPRDAVIQSRIEMPRSAGTDVDAMPVVRRRWNLLSATNVVREHADAEIGAAKRRSDVAHDVLDAVPDGVVAQVRPAMVHVEHGDVDRLQLDLR